MSQATAAVTTAPPPVRFPALRVPAYRAYWATATLSMVADNIEHVIGYWLLWELTHSPFWLGYAVFSHWAPFILFSLHAGAWADRFDNRWLIQASQAMYIVCSATLGILYITGHLQLWHMIILLAIHGFSGVVNLPSAQVLIHDLVGKQDLPNALSLSAGGRNVAQFLGPMIGGLLMFAFGPGGGLLANAALYLPFCLVLFLLKPRRSAAPVRKATNWRSLLEGLDAARQQPLILGAILIVTIPMAIVGGFQAMMPAYATELGDPQRYSWLLTANGAGAIVGALILGYLGRIGHKGLMLCAATLLWTALLVAFALTPWFWLAFGIMLFVGAWSIVSNAMSQALVQSLAPDDKRGRVMGLYGMLVFGPRVLSGPLLGGLGVALGAMPALGVLASVVVVGVGALVAALPALRELE